MMRTHSQNTLSPLITSTPNLRKKIEEKGQDLSLGFACTQRHVKDEGTFYLVIVTGSLNEIIGSLNNWVMVRDLTEK